MNKRIKISTIFIYGVFICYIILLAKILFLSRVSIFEMFDSQREMSRSINLVPFGSIFDYLSGGSEMMKRFAFGNVAGNIAIFVPLGAYVAFFNKDKRVAINLLYMVAASLFAEVIQWAFGIGAADVDDIILNSLGGLVGLLGYKMLALMLRNDKNLRIAFILLSAAGLPVIYYYLFMIRMRF